MTIQHIQYDIAHKQNNYIASKLSADFYGVCVSVCVSVLIGHCCNWLLNVQSSNVKCISPLTD